MRNKLILRKKKKNLLFFFVVLKIDFFILVDDDVDDTMIEIITISLHHRQLSSKFPITDSIESIR